MSPITRRKARDCPWQLFNRTPGRFIVVLCSHKHDSCSQVRVDVVFVLCIAMLMSSAGGVCLFPAPTSTAPRVRELSCPLHLLRDKEAQHRTCILHLLPPSHTHTHAHTHTRTHIHTHNTLTHTRSHSHTTHTHTHIHTTHAASINPSLEALQLCKASFSHKYHHYFEPNMIVYVLQLSLMNIQIQFAVNILYYICQKYLYIYLT